MLSVLHLLQQQIALIAKLIEREEAKLALEFACQHHHKETFVMSVVTTDDFAVRVRPFGLDVDGVKTVPTDLTATIDQPTLASVAADPDNPGAFLVQRLPATDPNAGALTVTATFTTPSGISASSTVEFDPGVETSLALSTELVAKSPPDQATGDPAAGNGAAAGADGSASI